MHPVCRLTLPLALVALPALANAASYYRDVRPILQRHCHGCHERSTKSSNLDLTTYEGLMAGDQLGPSVKAAGPSDSLILKSVTGELQPQMPMGQRPLTAEQIASIRTWIEAGAKDDTPPEARETISLDKPISYSQP